VRVRVRFPGRMDWTIGYERRWTTSSQKRGGVRGREAREGREVRKRIKGREVRRWRMEMQRRHADWPAADSRRKYRSFSLLFAPFRSLYGALSKFLRAAAVGLSAPLPCLHLRPRPPKSKTVPSVLLSQ
jgi:hypothetical protein